MKKLVHLEQRITNWLLQCIVKKCILELFLGSNSKIEVTIIQLKLGV